MLKPTDLNKFKAGSNSGRPGRAFTLVELAGVVLVLTCLVALGLPTIVRANQKSKGVNCRANLRQLGLALQAYTETSDGRLPGPAFILASAAYDETSTNELAWYLAAPLSCPPPARASRIAPPFLCPAHDPARGPKEQRVATDYALADARAKLPPPFGQIGGGAIAPLKVEALGLLGRPDEQVALSDADKANVNPTLPGWSALPRRLVHASFRNHLFFDWHVGTKEQ